MADRSQQTEKPTPRRLQKAREKGDFPTAREFVSAVPFLVFSILSAAYFPDWLSGTELAFRGAFRQATTSAPLTSGGIVSLMSLLTHQALVPIAGLGLVLSLLTLGLQLATTGMGLSAARLAPKFERLNPATRFREMFANNLGQFAQAVLLLPLLVWMVWSLVRDRLPDVLRLPLLPVKSGAEVAGALLDEILRRSALALAAIGAVMLVRDRARYQSRLRMTKQEVRDEARESEGNPQIKARVRRIQRDMRRRNMMREVPKATAVIVNPTHYAVALRYDQGAMAAPRVVAKGRNYLAARIRHRATENQVPIIENPPLAQALYKTVEVGQDIPPHLYRAVAEILAYIFRVMHKGANR